jgi:hypothetical protein
LSIINKSYVNPTLYVPPTLPSPEWTITDKCTMCKTNGTYLWVWETQFHCVPAP